MIFWLLKARTILKTKFCSTKDEANATKGKQKER